MTGAAGALAACASSPSMGVVASPLDVGGFYRGPSTTALDITTSSVLAVVSGGASPFTYAWTQTGSSPYTWTIGSASAATTNFTAHSLGPGGSASTIFQIEVTDAAGTKARATVGANVDNASTG